MTFHISGDVNELLARRRVLKAVKNHSCTSRQELIEINSRLARLGINTRKGAPPDATTAD